MSSAPAPYRSILIASAVVLVVGVTASSLVAPKEPPAPGYPSSYSPSPTGAKATYLLLKTQVGAIERFHLPPTSLPGLDVADEAGRAEDVAGVVLVLAQPLTVASRRERAALMDFVEAGGRVIATDLSGAALLGLDDVVVTTPLPMPRDYRALAASPLARSAPVVTMTAGASLPLDSTSASPVVGDTTGAVVAVARRGRGVVIWWASSTPLTNAGIGATGALPLLLNSVGDDASLVLWDEYFHGAQPSFATFFWRTPLIAAYAQLALLGGLVLVAFARRRGTAWQALPASRLSPMEFVDTMGAIYQRAHATSVAVEAADARFRRLLSRRLGIPPATPDDAQGRIAVERLGSSAASVASALAAAARARASARVPGREALALVQSLTALERGLRLDPDHGASATPQAPAAGTVSVSVPVEGTSHARRSATAGSSTGASRS